MSARTDRAEETPRRLSWPSSLFVLGVALAVFFGLHPPGLAPFIYFQF